jgi:hypothetical protein
MAISHEFVAVAEIGAGNLRCFAAFVQNRRWAVPLSAMQAVDRRALKSSQHTAAQVPEPLL